MIQVAYKNKVQGNNEAKLSFDFSYFENFHTQFQYEVLPVFTKTTPRRLTTKAFQMHLLF